MALKETPIGYRVYYKKLREDYTQRKEEALSVLDDLKLSVNALHEDIKSNAERYKNEFNINLFDYKEFVENTYIDGLFIRLAKGAFINRKGNHVLVADLFDLYNLAKKQKQIYDLNEDIRLYDKILLLTIKQYHTILLTFYNEVHKKMIIKGYGYVFEGDLGWTCINRCRLNKVKRHIDFAATRKKKEDIIARGGKPYNKEEAEWCEKNGLPYDGEPYTVLQHIESCYEVPLIDCKLPNGRKFKFEAADTRGLEGRGKTNEELREIAKDDLEAICNMQIGLKTKISLCNNIDKTLYTNFIRNENQEPINAVKINRKNR
ncbi:MAG: hypothetical protein J6Y28_09760 [Acholeplasmatales bacterium]|nr:hypothetical protein [Methanobrevibacter sp.]MBP5446444.1 hypothetical protein [Acholeplasmatales bacterium]